MGIIEWERHLMALINDVEMPEFVSPRAHAAFLSGRQALREALLHFTEACDLEKKTRLGEAVRFVCDPLHECFGLSIESERVLSSGKVAAKMYGSRRRHILSQSQIGREGVK